MKKLLNSMLILAIALSMSIFLGCDKDDDNENLICFSFDQRQCAGDEWADLISNEDSWIKRTDAMKDYLESKDVDVEDIFIDPNFHEAVCGACFVCPEEHRFFVKIEEESRTDLQTLELLNLEEGDCAELFN